jgi:TetR/AcrR family transcriptional regulator
MWAGGQGPWPARTGSRVEERVGPRAQRANRQPRSQPDPGRSDSRTLCDPKDEAASPERARDRILHVAARLYALHGYDGTSMREIAEAAGVTKPLIYYHFESKEQLFSILLRESIGLFRERSCSIVTSGGSAVERLGMWIRSSVEIARRNPAVFAFTYEVMTKPGTLPLDFDYKAAGVEIFHDLVGLIESGQQRGEFRPIDAHAVAALPIAALGMYVSAVLSDEHDTIPEGLEDQWLGIITQGLEVRTT